MKPIISFDNFTFTYDAQKKPTLKGINLDIYPGEKILICGPSGSGKSTLGNCINGLVPFSYDGKIEGHLFVDCIDTQKSSIFELSSHVGTILQDPDGQFVGLTVAEDIAFALENDCVEQEQMKLETLKAAKIVDIDKFMQHAPYELSGGQKQRVSMAGVLVDDVNILLLDEPLANLDPATGKSSIELIDAICQEKKTTVVIIEHRIEDVLWKNVDRVILMNEGTIVYNGSTNNLLASDLLTKYGIREPLYISAMRYADIDLNNRGDIASINTLELSNDDANKINKWYFSQTKAKKNVEKEVILKVENLNFAYDESQQVLFDINLEMYHGDMLAIVGKNGAGKSTLAKLICGFEKPQSGNIYYKNENITNYSIRKISSRIGYVMQNPNQMISQALIFDEVAMGIRNIGYSEETIKQKVYETLKVCGLYELRNWPISALSFGQKKRVTIASILVMNPEIIILDEPTAGQDFAHYTDIMEFLKSLNDRGITIIMITHDMHLMLEYTDRCLAFADGHLINDSTGAQVLCDYQLVDRASLKETSLFNVANSVGIKDAVDYINRFISYERNKRNNG